MSLDAPGSGDARPVLVVGGTGHYGSRIVRNLTEMGRPVRVLSRSAAAARKVVGPAVEIAEGDVTDAASVDRALAGAERLLVAISALTPASIRRHREIERDGVLRLVERARALGLRRIVYLCGYELRPNLIEKFDFQVGRIQLEVSGAVAASGLDWTILGEAPSMVMFFATTRGDRMYFPGGGPPAFPTVSAEDVGKIGAQAVVRDDLGGRRFRVTGPEALSFPEAARRIARVTGRPMTFRAVPLGPLRVAAAIARPLSPYFHLIVTSARFLNQFPQDLAQAVPEDHRTLVSTFQYEPRTFEMEVERWAKERG